MAVYNNRYYPDSQAVTWADLGTRSWAEFDYNWTSGNTTIANASVTWSYTTTATDLGTVKSFYPTTQVVWDDAQPVTIAYEYSTDGSSYTSTGAGPITARYIRTNVTTSGSYLTSIQTDINYDPKIETLYNVDTSTLSGNVTHRILNTNNFSRVQSISITPATTETRPISGQLVSNDTGNITIRAVNLDTWDKVAVDATVNIVVVGFPALTANTATGTVSVRP